MGFSAGEGGSMRSSPPKGINYSSCVRGQQVLAHSGLASCGVSYPDTTEILVKNQYLTPV